MSGSRMDSAKLAAKSLLDSLSADNFVSVVDFDSQARRPFDPACAGTQLLKSSKENVESLKTFVDGIRASGATQYGAALTEAYALLNGGTPGQYASRSVVIFLSDGVPSDSSSSINTIIQTQQPENCILLTYGLAFDGDVLQSMADVKTGGAYQSISDESNLRSVLGSYYEHPTLLQPRKPSRCIVSLV